MPGCDMQIDYLDIFIHCGLDATEKNGKYVCPFCDKLSFKVYYDTDNIRGHCHHCKFSGNPVKFYSEFKSISYYEALAELKAAYGAGSIKLRKLSDKEARDKICADLYFLSLARMYFAFYGDSLVNKKYLQEKSGIPPSTFSRVMNGNIESVSKENWNKVMVYLKSKIDIEKFMADFGKKEQYFSEQVNLIAKDQLYKFK